MEIAKKSFKIEFLNRVDDIIIFHSLTRENLLSIIDLELNKIKSRLAAQKLQLNISDEVKSPSNIAFKFG